LAQSENSYQGVPDVALAITSQRADSESIRAARLFNLMECVMTQIVCAKIELSIKDKEVESHLKDTSAEVQKMLNTLWSKWNAMHVMMGSRKTLQAWLDDRVRRYAELGDKPDRKASKAEKAAYEARKKELIKDMPLCDVQSLDEDKWIEFYGLTPYRTIADEFDTINVQVVAAVVKEWVGEVTQDNAKTGTLKLWQAILLGRQAIPSFNKPMPIPIQDLCSLDKRVLKRDGDRRFLSVGVSKGLDERGRVRVCYEEIDCVLKQKRCVKYRELFDLMIENKTKSDANKANFPKPKKPVKGCTKSQREEYEAKLKAFEENDPFPRLKSASIFYNKDKRKWFVSIAYQRAEQTYNAIPSKRMVLRPCNDYPFRFDITQDGKEDYSQVISPRVIDKDRIKHLRRRMLKKQEGVSGAISNSSFNGAGRGKRNKFAPYSKLRGSWIGYVNHYNQKVVDYIVKRCVDAGFESLVLAMPPTSEWREVMCDDGKVRSKQFYPRTELCLSQCEEDEYGRGGWEWHELENKFKVKCKHFGVKFEVRNGGESEE
jgi:hypothetical protein